MYNKSVRKKLSLTYNLLRMTVIDTTALCTRQGFY